MEKLQEKYFNTVRVRLLNGDTEFMNVVENPTQKEMREEVAYASRGFIH